MQGLHRGTADYKRSSRSPRGGYLGGIIHHSAREAQLLVVFLERERCRPNEDAAVSPIPGGTIHIVLFLAAPDSRIEDIKLLCAEVSG